MIETNMSSSSVENNLYPDYLMCMKCLRRSATGAAHGLCRVCASQRFQCSCSPCLSNVNGGCKTRVGKLGSMCTNCKMYECSGFVINEQLSLCFPVEEDSIEQQPPSASILGSVPPLLPPSAAVAGEEQQQQPRSKKQKTTPHHFVLDKDHVEDLCDQGFSKDSLGGAVESLCDNVDELEVSQLKTTAALADRVLRELEMTDPTKYGDVHRKVSCIVEDPENLPEYVVKADDETKAQFLRTVARVSDIETA